VVILPRIELASARKCWYKRDLHRFCRLPAHVAPRQRDWPLRANFDSLSRGGGGGQVTSGELQSREYGCSRRRKPWFFAGNVVFRGKIVAHFRDFRPRLARLNTDFAALLQATRHPLEYGDMCHALLLSRKSS